MGRRILATSGGFMATDRWGVMRPGPMFLEALRRTGSDRPRVCLVMTASGDDASYLARSYAALGSAGCDVDHLALFTMPNRDPEEILARSDLVWVGGGSVANLLALWRLHGVDEAMRAAWERGTILAGVSAGSICWHVGGPTDSFGPTLEVVDNALGLLPYGNGVHYDSEEQRRPLLQSVVADGTLPMSYATDDRVGIWYENDEAVEVLSDLPDSAPDSGPAAYRIERIGGEAKETRLPVGPMS
jgi:peptidase E